MDGAATERVTVRFTGRGSDILSGDGLVTLLLYILIVTIPIAWLRTMRWVARNIQVSTGSEVRFSATGLETYGVFALAIVIASMQRLRPGEWFFGGTLLAQSITAAWWCLAIAINLALGYAITKWVIERFTGSSGTQLTFTGSGLTYVGWQVLTWVSYLTIVGWAWVSAAFYRWLFRHVATEPVPHEFSFTGTGGALLWRIIAFALGSIPIVTLPWTIAWLTRWYVESVSILRRGVTPPPIPAAATD
jgi:hypothetical protein